MQALGLRWYLAAGTALSAASTALAAGDGYNPPQLPDSPAWLTYLFAAMLTGLACVVAFRNARRIQHVE